MGLTLLLSSCNNSPNKTTNAEATQKTKAEATQKTKEAGKLLPISEGNHWEYKHEIKDVGSSNSPDYQPYQSSRIEVDSVEETPLKEKLASFTYYGLGDRNGYFDGKKKYNIKIIKSTWNHYLMLKLSLKQKAIPETIVTQSIGFLIVCLDLTNSM